MLNATLERLLQTGSLSVTWPNGRMSRYGQNKASGPDVAVRLVGPLTPLKLGLHPDLYLGEAYMSGALRLERGTLWDLMSLLGRNLATRQDGSLLSASLVRCSIEYLSGILAGCRAKMLRITTISRADSIIRSLPRISSIRVLTSDGRISILMRPNWQKKRHLAAKLKLQPGQRVLDIGCGWGGLALFLAQTQDVEGFGNYALARATRGSPVVAPSRRVLPIA